MLLRSRWTQRAALIAALLLLPQLSWGAGLYASHGNQKWGKGSLTVSQARRSIAMSVAKRLKIPTSGFKVVPPRIKVSIKMAPDGKTAVWRATVKPSAGTPYHQLGRKVGHPVVAQLYGTIDVTLRKPERGQVEKRAYAIYQQRSTANARTDWRQAEQHLTRFGNQPRESTVRRLAYQIYQGRMTANAQSDWLRAEKELRQDLGGNRVTFINSSKAYNNTLRTLFFNPQK